MDGLNNFFANPTVQEQASQIFAQRDPVRVGIRGRIRQLSHSCTYRDDDRFITTARGTVKIWIRRASSHNSAIVKTLSKARQSWESIPRVLFPHGCPGFA